MTRKAVVILDSGSRHILELQMLAEGEDQADPQSALPEGREAMLLELADDEAIERAYSGHWGVDPAGKLLELPFRAALLGADGVLEDVVDLAGSHELTEAHVDLRPHGGDCDLPLGRYRWDSEGNTFVPLPKHARRSGAGGVDLERALADFWGQLAEAGSPLPKSTQAWLKQYAGTIDKKGS